MGRRLRSDGVTWTDVAQACQVRIADAQAALGHTEDDHAEEATQGKE
ncbi:hypothetical protein ACGFNU_49700 [Spirillospora sp. NPDC048911]